MPKFKITIEYDGTNFVGWQRQENGQSVQINPSNPGEKVIYNSSQFTFFEIKKDSVSYRINIDF